MPSLFGHLAGRFATHPENLATEALSYVLGNSRHAAKTLLSLLAEIEPALPLDLGFESQVAGDDHARPDIAGSSRSLGSVLLMEAKFWAGLTAHQPVTYLRRLPPRRPAMLVVIAPALRFATLWAELADRCTAANLSLGQKIEKAPELWFAGVADTRTLVLVSWRILLDTLRRALEHHHDGAMASDVAQLAGLCAQMDTEAFLPLRPEEITNAELPRRLLQLAEIVDHVATIAVTEGLCSRRDAAGRGLTSAAGAGYYGRYLSMRDHTVFLALEHRQWARAGATPLWLRLDKNGSPGFASALEPGSTSGDPGTFRVIEDGGYVWVPLRVPAGAEKSQVVEAVTQQLRMIAPLLPTAAAAAVVGA